MKKIYMKPTTAIFALSSQTALLTGSDDSYRLGMNGINMDQNDYGGSCAKKNGFTLWGDDSDEVDDNNGWSDSFSPWD